MSTGRTSPGGAPFSAESYFATQPPPPTLDSDVQKVRAFVERQREAGRRVVLVTVSTFAVSFLLGVVSNALMPVSYMQLRRFCVVYEYV